MKSLRIIITVFLVLFIAGKASSQLSLIIFSENGEKFTAYVNNSPRNDKPASRVETDRPGGPTFKVRINFEDGSIPEISKIHRAGHWNGQPDLGVVPLLPDPPHGNKRSEDAAVSEAYPVPAANRRAIVVITKIRGIVTILTRAGDRADASSGLDHIDNVIGQ